MNTECYPISTMPGTTALFRDYAVAGAARVDAVKKWYPADPFAMDWAAVSPTVGHAETLANELLAQADGFGVGKAARANIEKLRRGAAAVVTGQQVTLFGGSLLTLLKAATAIRKAKDATVASGREHVPVFWLATEDHDLAEVDQVALLSKTAVEKLTLGLKVEQPVSVGGIVLETAADGGRARVDAELDRASELLGWGPVAELLRSAYAENGATLVSAFGRMLSELFASQGLIVMDAATRGFHAMGARVLRAAIERSEELETALMARSKELETAGYHAQVLVTVGHSLLFLIDAQTGARLPLRRTVDGWKAGARFYSKAELLEILVGEPERLSPNALLRPVFQDAILPTAAYVGGPAEVAYFAQSEVVYGTILGRVTPVLPRLSATLIEPAIATAMASHEVTLGQVFEAHDAAALALRLGARAMPIEGKRKLAAVGNAMDAELGALTEYMMAMSAELGRAAGVSASKMLYQMNRLRRMAADFEVQKEASLKKHATAIALNLFPGGILQERKLAGVWFAARYGEGLAELLVEHASQECPGHRVIYL